MAIRAVIGDVNCSRSSEGAKDCIYPKPPTAPRQGTSRACSSSRMSGSSSLFSGTGRLVIEESESRPRTARPRTASQSSRPRTSGSRSSRSRSSKVSVVREHVQLDAGSRAAGGLSNLRLLLNNHSTISKNQLRQAMAKCGVGATDADLERWAVTFGTTEGRINCKKLLQFAAHNADNELDSVASSFFSHSSGVSTSTKSGWTQDVPIHERLFAQAGANYEKHREPPPSPSSAHVRLEQFIQENSKYAHLSFEDTRSAVAKLLSKRRFIVEEAAFKFDENSTGVMETDTWRAILDEHIFPIETEKLFRMLKPFLLNDMTEVEYERFIEVLIDFFGQEASTKGATAESIPMEFFSRSSRSGTPRTQTSASTARRMERVLGKSQKSRMMHTPRGSTPRTNTRASTSSRGRR